MAVFFDSVPNTQARLLTFRCPNYKDSDPKDKHFITIAWKARDGKVKLIVENILYQGKPLALTPNAIEHYQGDTFPEGTMFSTCTCFPKRNNKLCYIATEITPASQIKTGRESLKEPSLKATKKISRDLKASTRLLVQLYDGVEALTNAHEKAHGVYLQKFLDLHSKIAGLESMLGKLSEMMVVFGGKIDNAFIKVETQISKTMGTEALQTIDMPKSTGEKIKQEDAPAYIDVDNESDKEMASEVKCGLESDFKAVLQEKALDPKLDQYVDKLRQFVHDAQDTLSKTEVEAIEKESDVFMESSVVAQVEEELDDTTQAKEELEDGFSKVLQDEEDEMPEDKPTLGVTQIMEAAVLRAAVTKYEQEMKKENKNQKPLK